MGLRSRFWAGQLISLMLSFSNTSFNYLSTMTWHIILYKDWQASWRWPHSWHTHATEQRFHIWLPLYYHRSVPKAQQHLLQKSFPKLLNPSVSCIAYPSELTYLKLFSSPKITRDQLLSIQSKSSLAKTNFTFRFSYWREV